MEKKLVVLICLLFPVVTMAQSRFYFEGKITEAKSKEIVELVAIQIKELNRWTTSDMNGNFSFKDIPKGTYTLQASCLGFEQYEYPITIERDITGFKLMIKQSSLGLEEVIVTAKENTSLSSSSKIESTALEHVQPNSLADVMQLVPGQITLNPDMSGTNQITIRDINTYSSEDKIKNPKANDALGTAIIIDGSPINNDANLQTINTAKGGTAQAYSTAGQGIDLRQISTDNIESIEVIRGIPSVQYGELTSGAVLVKTKSGQTPFKAKVKADPKIKQASVSKGFLLPGTNNGAVNLDFDYTHSFDDLREPASIYKRITGQLGYSNTLFKTLKPLSINAKMSYFQTIDDSKNDPDQLQLEKEREKEIGLNLKLYGKWSIQKWWLGNITYNFAGSFENQEYYSYKLYNASATPISTAYTSGEYKADILPSSYYSELTIDGKPFDYFATINLDARFNIGNVRNNIMYGIDWRSSGNKGKGRLYDLSRPPSAAITTRPRAFNDIPASKKLALFIEDKVSIPFGRTKLTSQFGIRYNNLLPKGIFSTNGFTTVEPRVNTTYDILKYDRKRTVQDLSIRFGYGETSKTPTMLHMYPDKAYFDKISFNYYPDLIVITTEVMDNSGNPDLKPMTNKKFEIGTDFSINGIKFMFTGFKEKIRNGFSWRRNIIPLNYRKWDALAGGRSPVFENGDITYIENGEIKIHNYAQETEFIDYSSPANNYSVDKKGIEYVVNFGQIKTIRTNFLVDGAYFHIKRTNDVLPYSEKENTSFQGDYFPYYGLLPGNKGNISQRLNSNFKTTTHIPELKMIFTFNLQLIWLDTYQYFWDDENGKSRAYSLGENNEKLYGQFQNTSFLNIDPIGFYDMDMKYHEWQNDYSFIAPYSTMVNKLEDDYFETETYPVNWQLNLKLTKEFGEVAKLSFFANNLFNHRPLYRLVRSGTYDRRNQSAYFGAELTFSF